MTESKHINLQTDPRHETPRQVYLTSKESTIQEKEPVPDVLSSKKSSILFIKSLKEDKAIEFCKEYRKETIDPIASEELSKFRVDYFISCFARNDNEFKMTYYNQIQSSLSPSFFKDHDTITRLIIDFSFTPPPLEHVFRSICMSDWFLIHGLETQGIERCLESLGHVFYHYGYVETPDGVLETLFSLLMLETQRTNDEIASRKSQQLSEQSYVDMLQGYQKSFVARRMYQYVEQKGLSGELRGGDHDKACCCVQ